MVFPSICNLSYSSSLCFSPQFIWYPVLLSMCFLNPFPSIPPSAKALVQGLFFSVGLLQLAFKRSLCFWSFSHLSCSLFCHIGFCKTQIWLCPFPLETLSKRLFTFPYCFQDKIETVAWYLRSWTISQKAYLFSLLSCSQAVFQLNLGSSYSPHLQAASPLLLPALLHGNALSCSLLIQGFYSVLPDPAHVKPQRSELIALSSIAFSHSILYLCYYIILCEGIKFLSTLFSTQLWNQVQGLCHFFFFITL